MSNKKTYENFIKEIVEKILDFNNKVMTQGELGPLPPEVTEEDFIFKSILGDIIISVILSIYKKTIDESSIKFSNYYALIFSEVFNFTLINVTDDKHHQI